MARIVTPKGIRPSSPGVRPSGPQKRSALHTVRTTSKRFKRFESAFEAFDQNEEEFKGAGHRVIEIVTPGGQEARVHITGLSPFQNDPTGILQALEGAVLDEIRDMITKDLEEESRKADPRQKSTREALQEIPFVHGQETKP